MGSANDLRRILLFIAQWNQGTLLWLLCLIASFFLMLAGGSFLIRWLKSLPGMKWSAREDTPDTHLQKAGTPSMGGLGIIGAAVFGYASVVATLMTVLKVVIPASSFSLTFLYGVVTLPVFTVLHMLLGYVDDRSKATGRGGLRARDKFLGQLLLSVAFTGLVILVSREPGSISLEQNPPFHWLPAVSPWVWLAVAAAAVVFTIGTCNAVNITDGIDGLAAGLAVQVGLFVLLARYSTGDVGGPVTGFWAALAGAAAGFLFFNRYPAKVFMGDTGSLALGAALGGAAILTHSVLLLPFIGFIFYVELLSVTTQVLYFKWTRKRTGEGKRLFRRAPLHHHFELGGWSEWRVVGTFWLVNLFTGTIGLILWHQGIIPRFP